MIITYSQQCPVIPSPVASETEQATNKISSARPLSEHTARIPDLGHMLVLPRQLLLTIVLTGRRSDSIRIISSLLENPSQLIMRDSCLGPASRFRSRRPFVMHDPPEQLDWYRYSGH